MGEGGKVGAAASLRHGGLCGSTGLSSGMHHYDRERSVKTKQQPHRGDASNAKLILHINTATTNNNHQLLTLPPVATRGSAYSSASCTADQNLLSLMGPM